MGAALAIAGMSVTSESGSEDAQTRAVAADSVADEHGSAQKRLGEGNELLTRSDDDDAPELTLNDILTATDIHRDV